MAYTNIDDPSAYFQALAYTGTGTNGQAFTFDGNSDLQPDFLWGKRRDATANHILSNTNVDFTYFLSSNTTSAENTAGAKFLTSDTDGFTCGTSGNVNASGGTYVAWGWKANGGTTSTNNDGSKTTTVQANTDAGFSILNFTTNGTDTFGHGLGVKPSVVIAKPRSPGGWIFMTDVIDGSVDYSRLQTADAFTNTTYSAFTSSVFQYNDSFNVNTVAYCFAEKQGFSKFGKFTANGNSNGTFVYTGFKPAFLMWKISSGTGNWSILNTDNKNYNVADAYLSANLTNAETTATPVVDLLSNGFKDRYGLINGSTYFYMAFAENPFVTSTGVPTTAR